MVDAGSWHMRMELRDDHPTEDDDSSAAWCLKSFNDQLLRKADAPLI